MVAWSAPRKLAISSTPPPCLLATTTSTPLLLSLRLFLSPSPPPPPNHEATHSPFPAIVESPQQSPLAITDNHTNTDDDHDDWVPIIIKTVKTEEDAGVEREARESNVDCCSCELPHIRLSPSITRHHHQHLHLQHLLLPRQ